MFTINETSHVEDVDFGEVGFEGFEHLCQIGYIHIGRVGFHAQESEGISAGAKVGYERSWKHRMGFRKGQGHPVWLDIRDESWGGNLMNFILSEHDVLGLRARQ